MHTLTEYLEQYALLSIEKQDKLALLLGDYTAELDLDAGTVRFNDSLDCSMQVLGTESDNTLTWLWAWSDEQTEEVPPALVRASRELRDWGMQKGLREFTLPAVDLNRADGNVLAMIASELCRASCYYRDAYEGGSAFFLLFDKTIDAQPSFDLTRLSHRFLDLISRYELNHRNTLASYLRAKGAPPPESGPLIVEFGLGEQLRADFDEAGRLRLLNGKEPEL